MGVKLSMPLNLNMFSLTVNDFKLLLKVHLKTCQKFEISSDFCAKCLSTIPFPFHFSLDKPLNTENKPGIFWWLSCPKRTDVVEKCGGLTWWALVTFEQLRWRPRAWRCRRSPISWGSRFLPTSAGGGGSPARTQNWGHPSRHSCANTSLCERTAGERWNSDSEY